MADELVLTLAHLGFIAALGLVGAALLPGRFRPGWFLAALGLYALYNWLLTRFYFALPNLEGADWNWFGKALSLVGMLIVASLPVFGWRRCGLTLHQKRGTWAAWLVLAAFSLLFVYLAISDGEGAADWETIAFQWTMPGLDEEVFYRGVLLMAMNEAFSSRYRILGAPIGYGGLLTSVLFGLAHALDYGGGSLSFDGMSFLITGVPSLLLLWLRERTGSVLLPIIAHNIANGASTVF